MRCSRRCPPWSSACAASRPDVRLFLFDVDGTLVTARGAGRAAFGRALQATYGTPGAVDVYDFRGKTDPRIVWDLMRGAGLDDAAITRGLDAFGRSSASAPSARTTWTGGGSQLSRARARVSWPAATSRSRA